MSREEFYREAQLAHTAWVRRVDSASYRKFEKFAEARRGSGKRHT